MLSSLERYTAGEPHSGLLGSKTNSPTHLAASPLPMFCNLVG